jgi:hypothetical protein
LIDWNDDEVDGPRSIIKRHAGDSEVDLTDKAATEPQTDGVRMSLAGYL